MSDATADHAHAFLRAHTTADLRFDEHFRPIKYVIAPDGRLVAPVMVAMLHCADVVLFIPQVTEHAMQVQVTLQQFDEHGPDGALADRWRIHHGDPDDVNWAKMDIDAARFQAMVIDGDGLLRANPLADDEPALCRLLNHQHTDDLRVLCRRFADINIHDPVMVAIDPLGIDVRGRFDVVRINATHPMHTADEAKKTLQSMIDLARAGAAGD